MLDIYILVAIIYTLVAIIYTLVAIPTLSAQTIY